MDIVPPKIKKKMSPEKNGPISKGKDDLPSIHCSGDMLFLCGVIHKYKSIYIHPTLC